MIETDLDGGRECPDLVEGEVCVEKSFECS